MLFVCKLFNDYFVNLEEIVLDELFVWIVDVYRVCWENCELLVLLMVDGSCCLFVFFYDWIGDDEWLVVLCEENDVLVIELLIVVFCLIWCEVEVFYWVI